VNHAPDRTLAAYLDTLRAEVDAGTERMLASLAHAPTVVTSAMQYSLMAGGKRLRPCLTLAAAEATGASAGLMTVKARALALPAAVAVEMIHTYSLVHDDLPAMDDDALRRGRPTSHVVHGDGLAILAGDGLLTEAFVVLASMPSPASLPGAAAPDSGCRLRALAILAAAAGAAGMVGGQAIDLAAAGKVPGHRMRLTDQAALEDMHARKTGALIRAAATMGAIMAGASDAAVTAVDDYARDLGLAFQIVDDVLDVEGSADALGKTAGKDAAAGKPTYPARFGIARSRQLASDCVDRAVASITRAGIGGRLSDIARWSLTRTT
jgi:geranylgeranyl pyrophosphate synthase